ncbi:MAG: hypothetical protein JXN65_01050 [Clostridia bacterium]|nr:hypothetical protein [Clostridia bacterium]
MSEYKKTEQNKMYFDLRENVLSLSGGDMETDAAPLDCLRALVEFRVSGTPVTIMASGDSTASIYFGTGGGYLGGGQKSPKIAELARYLVHEAQNMHGKMSMTDEFPVPDDGAVKYYSVTKSGVYCYTGGEKQAQQKECEFFKLYYIAHYIITEYREISEQSSAQ